MEASEKPARNIMIRKFNELISMRTLEEALTHLREEEVVDAVESLQQVHPKDNLINRRSKTLKMAKIMDELKNQMTYSEKVCLLEVLRLEDVALENQITLTKSAIDKREQAKELIDQTLQALTQQNDFQTMLNIITDELFEAITLLQNANPAHQFPFINLIKEVRAMKETILESDQDNLLDAIKTGSFDELNQAMLKAKAAMSQHKALAALLTKYTQAATFEELYQGAQNERVKNAKSFWKPFTKDPKKVQELLLLNNISNAIMQDNQLKTEEKANRLYSLLLALKQQAQAAKSPVLAAALEIAIHDLAKHPHFKLEHNYQDIMQYFENNLLPAKQQLLLLNLKLAINHNNKAAAP